MSTYVNYRGVGGLNRSKMVNLVKECSLSLNATNFTYIHTKVNIVGKGKISLPSPVV